MKKYVYLIIIVLITIIVGCVCYFSIYKGNKSINTVAEKTEENISKNVAFENEHNNIEIKNDMTTPENVIENNIINNETNKTEDVKVANESKQSTNNKQQTIKKTTPLKQETNKAATQENNTPEPSVPEPSKTEIQEETKVVEEIKQDPPVEELKPIQLDFSKYDRYYPALNGGYTCFKKNQQEMSKLRGLLENAIQEFGYTNIKLVEDSSVISDRYFTANKTNAQNVIYNAEYFSIHYYSETEYHLTADGKESVFQVRSYAEIKGQ